MGAAHPAASAAPPCTAAPSAGLTICRAAVGRCACASRFVASAVIVPIVRGAPSPNSCRSCWPLGPVARGGSRARRLGSGLRWAARRAARLLPHLAMPTSPDTVLRLVRHLPLPRVKEPRVVGTGGWALRKGRSHGTIVVDLERRRPLDPARPTARDRPSARVVAPSPAHRGRDPGPLDGTRAGRDGGRAGRPSGRGPLALASRHPARAVERWLARSHARPRRLPALCDHGGRQPGQRLHAFRRSEPEIALGAVERARRVTAYEEVRRRHMAGETLMAIGRATGFARG